MMKFAIFREYKEDGKNKRVILEEWDQEKIIEALSKEFFEIKPWVFRSCFLKVIEEFKRESSKIP